MESVRLLDFNHMYGDSEMTYLDYSITTLENSSQRLNEIRNANLGEMDPKLAELLYQLLNSDLLTQLNSVNESMNKNQDGQLPLLAAHGYKKFEEHRGILQDILSYIESQGYFNSGEMYSDTIFEQNLIGLTYIFEAEPGEAMVVFRKLPPGDTHLDRLKNADDYWDNPYYHIFNPHTWADI